MEYLKKTKVIVDDLVKNVEKISKCNDSREISQLEVSCIKQLQLAHMQFGYVSRDIRNAVLSRRAAIRNAALKSTKETIDKVLGKKEEEPKTAPKEKPKAAPKEEEKPKATPKKEEEPKTAPKEEKPKKEEPKATPKTKKPAEEKK